MEPAEQVPLFRKVCGPLMRCAPLTASSHCPEAGSSGRATDEHLTRLRKPCGKTLKPKLYTAGTTAAPGPNAPLPWVEASLEALLAPKPPPGTLADAEAGYFAVADRWGRLAGDCIVPSSN